MSDPRWKHGMGRSDWHKPQPQLDTPTAYGWIRVGKGHLGCDIFQLGEARMRRVMPQDGLQDEWLVFIGGCVWASLSGSLAQITHEVKVELGLTIPFQGELATPPAHIAEVGI